MKFKWHSSTLGFFYLVFDMKNCIPKCTIYTYIQQHLETEPLRCNLILTVMQINPRLPLQRSHWRDVCWTHVTEARSESRWTMTVTEPVPIVQLHCVTWEWGRQENWLLYFVLSHQRCCLLEHMHTHPPPPPRTHTHTHTPALMHTFTF